MNKIIDLSEEKNEESKENHNKEMIITHDRGTTNQKTSEQMSNDFLGAKMNFNETFHD